MPVARIVPVHWSPTPIPAWNPNSFAPCPARSAPADGPELVLVLGLQRTGSTAALGFLRANFQGERIVGRQHGISSRHRDWLARGHAMGLDRFETKLVRFDAVRAALAAASRAFVVVTTREPVARAVSFFLYRNRARLGGFHDAQTGAFADPRAIARDLDDFCRLEARRQQAWWDEDLAQTLACDPAALRPGAWVSGPAATEIALVRCEEAGRDLQRAAMAIGPAPRPPVRANAMEDFGLAALARAFNRRFQPSPDVIAALRDADPAARLRPPLPQAARA